MSESVGRYSADVDFVLNLVDAVNNPEQGCRVIDALAGFAAATDGDGQCALGALRRIAGSDHAVFAPYAREALGRVERQPVSDPAAAQAGR